MQPMGLRFSDEGLPGPFDVSHAYRITMRIALAMAILPGLGTGFLLVVVVGFGLSMFAAWPELAQAHGQIQALGFVLLFIVAVALQLFPRFLAAPLQHPQRAIWAACALVLALVLRLLAQPLEPDILRTTLLVLATAGVPVGLVIAGWTFHGLPRASIQPSSGPSASWRRFVAVGGTALGGVLILWVWSGARLASRLWT